MGGKGKGLCFEWGGTAWETGLRVEREEKKREGPEPEVTAGEENVFSLQHKLGKVHKIGLTMLVAGGDWGGSKPLP